MDGVGKVTVQVEPDLLLISQTSVAATVKSAVLVTGAETGCLLLNVDQSVELNAPRLVAEAVGTFSVITGVVVPLATVEERSVPVVPRVSAATEVTVPEPLLLNVVQSVLDKKPLVEPLACVMLSVPAE